MARLPIPGADDGVWGDVLNDYLLQAFDSSGNLKAGSVGAAQIADSSIPQVKIQDLQSDLSNRLNTSTRGAVNGVASLDAGI